MLYLYRLLSRVNCKIKKTFFRMSFKWLGKDDFIRDLRYPMKETIYWLEIVKCSKMG